MSISEISRRTFVATGAAAAVGVLSTRRTSAAAQWRTLDHLLADAVAAQDVPFAIAAVSDSKGLLWEGAAGDAAPSLKASPDVICHLFSATKAIGSLAVAILIDRGKLKPETPVGDFLPQFKTIKVLDTMSPAGPVYRDPASPVLVRHLMTHTSGLAYGVWDKKANEWETFTKAPPPPLGTMESFTRPLMFDPGTSWTYGVGLDWAGFLVEKIDRRPIERFVQEEIFDPLGMDSTVFETDAVSSRVARIVIRGADGKFAPADFMTPVSHPREYGMGQACHGTARDYLKLLRVILNDGMAGNRQIVSTQTMTLLKENQIGDMRLPLPLTCYVPPISADLDLFPGQAVPLTHTMGFVRNETDIPHKRRAGSLTWAGVVNAHYWVDHASGIAATLFTQSLPFIEPRFLAFYARFEEAVYQQLKA